ncbi:MAG: aminomethyltransferase beta-barrel domain-containing protein, partial [Planctomycetota bacterium]
RQRAAQLGWNVAAKKDSQEICFVTRGRYDEFVRSVRPLAKDPSGDLVLADGKVVGRHAGVEGFTVGQRKKLGVALGEPAYVVRIEAETRRVVLGRREDLYRDRLAASGCNWLVPPSDVTGKRMVQIRYNAPPAEAWVAMLDEQRIEVRFDEPQFGVAPGQAVVCYDGNRVLGGGWIDSY